MNRVRATAVAAAVGLFGHGGRGDEPAWKPAAVVPAVAASAPVPAVVSAPAAPPAADPPVIPGQVQELSQWLPARRYPIDYPPKQPQPVVTVPAGGGPTAPLPDVPLAFRPATAHLNGGHRPPPAAPVTESAEPPAAPEPRALATSSLPPLQPLPQPREPAPTTVALGTAADAPPTTPTALPDVPPVADQKPSADAKPAPLPAPRPVEPAKKPVAPSTLAIDCPPAAAPVLEPVPGGAVSAATPMRGRVFGSPAVNLSRDYPLRDLFGTDLLTPGRARRLAAGSDEVLGSASDSFFVQSELLLWWANRPRIPVLATTSASGLGTGFLGDPDTRTLLGPGAFGPSFQTGFRVRAGGYLDECGAVGLDGSFFFLGRASESVAFDSAQFPVITRPFFAPNSAGFRVGNQVVTTPGEFGEVVARPNLSRGRLVIEQDRFLWGADVNYRCAVCRTCDGGNGWLLGYRHLNLHERLRITEFITAGGPDAPDPADTQVVVGDAFETRNRFHGGQIGRWWAGSTGRLDLDVRATVALGVTTSQVTISGFQNRTRPGEPTQSFTGGLLAAGPNLGTFRRSGFSVVPEATVNVGYLITPTLRAYVGYNFLYWSGVMRPGDQIDRVVDVTFVPNPPPGVAPSGLNRPQPTFTRSDFWAQGVQLGLELRW